MTWTATKVGAEKLAAVDACYRISIFEEHGSEASFDTCRKTVFGDRKTRDQIRRALCTNDDVLRWFRKCVSDIR